MEQNYQVVKGTVGRVICPVKESGFVVFELKTDASPVKVVGLLGAVTEGEEVEVTGYPEEHSAYGARFQGVSLVRAVPTSPESIKKFLTGCKIKGLTKKIAGRIVDEFGEFTFDVLMQTPEKLKEVEGMSDADYENISASVKQIFAMHRLTDLFRQYGIPPRYAQRAYAKWEDKAWDIIKEDPFLLCQEKIGLDFKSADRLLMQLGLPPALPHRMIECMRSRLDTEAVREGSTCMDVRTLLNLVSNQLNIPFVEVRSAFDQAVNDRELFTYEVSPTEQYVFLPEYFRAENYIASRLTAKLRFSPSEDFDCKAAIEQEEAATGITYNEKQKEAIQAAFSRGVMIITGGPGTGKTATLKAVIHLCERVKSKILLAAPTGRAAKRMTELTDHPASTIHRLLGAVPEEDEQFTFQHDENAPLEADVVIIDEFSMVDTLLFESLLRGISLTCRLILVGDADQLPSVGAGHLLKAMIESGQIKTVHLTDIVRQAEHSTIVKAAHAIISGNQQLVSGDGQIITNKKDDDCFFFNCQQSVVPGMVRMLCTERLPKIRNYDPFSDIQVISPRKDDNPLSVTDLNRLLQNALNPKQGDAVLQHGDCEFRVGDKVMQTQNDYEIEWEKDGEEGTGIFNGDTGLIKEIDNDRNVTVDFDGRTVVFENGHIGSLTLAYATTVHKSQGSEYSAVIMVLPDYMGQGLQNRNLLYTAVTRAKELLIILGSTDTLQRMIAVCQSDTRCTCLAQMLSGMAKEKPAAPFTAEEAAAFGSPAEEEVPF